MILVIGGAGYIGSHMILRLRELGEPHVVFDNLERGHRAAVMDSPLIEGDLRNPDDVDRLFDLHPEIDTVMHFAAYAYVGESVTEPGKYWVNNTSAVITLLEAMVKRGVKRFVFSSTCATFGEPEYLPIDEQHPQRPINPYGETKLTVEHVLADFDRAHGLRSVALRYFNAAGADPEGRIGEDHRPEVHLIPNAIYAAMGKTGPMKVFGSDYDTPDGTCVRDYIHVLDLADAHLKAVQHLRQDGDSRRYNLGNGVGFSIKQVLDVVGQVVGTPVPYEMADRRPGDPARLVGSSERIRTDWSWVPQYPSLDTIVEHAYAWHRKNPEGYGP
jgi:UDP-glucose 4-epimerase